MSVIALLTDYGTTDPYVGVMKGVIANIAPGLPIIDITHGVPPQSVLVAALHLDASWHYFPNGSVFVVVVDPGVGTTRRAVVATHQGRHFVGPDNGVFSLLPGPTFRRIDADWGLAERSYTFHGRDLFAPVAARLARGAAVDAVGPIIKDPVRIAIPEPEGPLGQVLYADHYGNAVTNLPGEIRGCVHVFGRVVPVRRTYAEVPRGGVIAVTGSTGRLEIAVRDGNAVASLGLEIGSPVVYDSGEP
jgi:hypothetical protein